MPPVPASPATRRTRCCASARPISRPKLYEAVRGAQDGAGDLFDSGSHIPDGELTAFREKLPEWQAQFEAAIEERSAERLAGTHRRGRRPDADASLSSLRVLTSDSTMSGRRRS